MIKIKNYLLKNKKYIIIAGIFISLIIAIIVVKKFDTEENEGLNIINFESSTTYEDDTEESEKIVVHITGSVKNEGIIKIDEGSRIADAIEAAGGLTDDADISRVNLAYELEDGQKIYIPNVDDTEEEADEYIEDGIDDIVLDDATSSSKSSLININKATAEELQQLNGIGESLAASIVAYREENGKFDTIEDIKNVSGIGDSKYENIKDYIKVK